MPLIVAATNKKVSPGFEKKYLSQRGKKKTLFLDVVLLLQQVHVVLVVVVVEVVEVLPVAGVGVGPAHLKIT